MFAKCSKMSLRANEVSEAISDKIASSPSAPRNDGNLEL